MKTKILSLSALTLGLVLTASCGSDTPAPQPAADDITTNPDAPAPAGTTEFGYRPSTRTTGIYSGSAVDFYWTLGDNLWVNTGSSLLKSVGDNIAAQLGQSGDTKAAGARFFFQGTFTETSYPVRYTGTGSTAGDRVTIASTQLQATPNDARHIGTSGDCGTATAVRQSAGNYSFMLDHQAAYLTFLPRQASGFASSVVLTQVKVTASSPIAGTYAFTDAGLASSPTSGGSNSITLQLGTAASTTGFSIPQASTPSVNAAVMVLAPGTYTTLTVEYTLYDTTTQVGGTVTRTYTNLTLSAGRNRRVETELGVPTINSNEYYMWDAAVGQHYWAGYESVQPMSLNGYNANYPKTSSDARWHSTVTFPMQASRSCANCPNVNELRWYVEKGNPHWDATTIWAFAGGHLYKAGAWLKKQSVIAAENGKTVAQLKTAAPNGTDYRTATTTAFYQDNTLVQGKPSGSSNYFFLPAAGWYENGRLNLIGSSAYYWTSSTHPVTTINTVSYSLSVRNNYMNLSDGNTPTVGFQVWTAQ